MVALSLRRVSTQPLSGPQPGRHWRRVNASTPPGVPRQKAQLVRIQDTTVS